MARSECKRCQSLLNEGDYFCGNCGAPTKLGLKYLESSERIGLTLNQLERSFQTGHISKEKYEEQKAKYSEELSKLNADIIARRPVAPQGTETPNAPQPAEMPTFSDAKSAVIYADPPQLRLHNAGGYIIAAIIIVATSLWATWGLVGEGFETVWLDQWYLLIFSLVGPAIYLFWMWRADKFEREPIYYVLLILGWGVFATLISFIGNSIFDMVGLGAAWLGAPIVEESAKAIGVYWIAKKAEFNNSMDGMVYGFASGMGFAWAENFFYIVLMYDGDVLFSLLRIFVFGLGHGLYTAYTGWSLGRAKVKNGFVKPGDMKLGLAMAMIAHGIYNSDIMEVNSFETLALWVILTLGTYTIILYALVRRSWAEEKKWLYDAGYAPKATSPN
jgi:RsiW-degrading membrane proteinase PrsW (M82 family)